jgi:anti-sigma-K factor RskA
VERDDTIHELTAAYALDALDGPEAEAFEEHLRHCEECREQVSILRDTATYLAHDAPTATPPSELRERVLSAVRAERGTVVQLRPRWAAPVASLAAVAACAALALGLWAATLHRTLGDREALLRSQAGALAVAATPGARRIPLSGGHGVLVVTPSGRAALVLSGLPKPASGKAFEAWVVTGKTAEPAGVFSPHGDTTAVELARSVPDGAQVALTIERAGGAPRPTGAPIVHSGTVA